MELIIIKSKDRYIRVKEDAYLCVNLDKASVFPMEKIETARAHEQKLKNENFKHVRLKKLVLTEEDL
jgi:hypothetical protein